MATAPKCKLCGVAHWGGQPHAFAKAAVAAVAKPTAFKAVAAKPAPVPDGRDALIAELRARIAELEAVAAVTVKRREANRDRMQKARRP